jgi:mono/diheme cytochrome c family protein
MPEMNGKEIAKSFGDFSRRLKMKFHRLRSDWRGFLLIVLALLFAVSARAQNDAASVYKARCAVCHGADGSGNTAVGKNMSLRDLRSADVQKQTDEQLFEITAKGKNKMPGYEKSLKEAQIKDLVAYIRDLAKKK